MVATRRSSSVMTLRLAGTGRSPPDRAAAVMCARAGRRKSPRTAVIVGSGHQLADTPGGLLRRRCRRSGPRLWQRSSRRAAAGLVAARRARPARRRSPPPERPLLTRLTPASARPGWGSAGAIVMASRPSTAASAVVMNAANSAGSVVLAAAGEPADGLERVEGRRERVRQAGRLPEAGHDAR